MAETIVSIETAKGVVELHFNSLQEAMGKTGAAHLETLRRWVRSLEEQRGVAVNLRE